MLDWMLCCPGDEIGVGDVAAAAAENCPLMHAGCNYCAQQVPVGDLCAFLVWCNSMQVEDLVGHSVVHIAGRLQHDARSCGVVIGVQAGVGEQETAAVDNQYWSTVMIP